MAVDLAPSVAGAVREASGRDDARFTKGTIKGVVRWAAEVVMKAAAGDASALVASARPSDLPRLEAALPRLAVADVVAARVVTLDLDGDPPTLVAELSPGPARLVLRAVEWPEPQWKVMALVGPGEGVPAGLPERSLTVPLPPAALRRSELDWLTETLCEVAAMLGADIAPLQPLATEWSSEDLGQGETRRVERRTWTRNSAVTIVEDARHEIYDGATPAWSSLWGSVTGLDGGAAITLTAALWRDEPVARLFVTAPRHLLDRVQAPAD